MQNQDWPNQDWPNQDFPNQDFPNQNFPNQDFPNQDWQPADWQLADLQRRSRHLFNLEDGGPNRENAYESFLTSREATRRTASSRGLANANASPDAYQDANAYANAGRDLAPAAAWDDRRGLEPERRPEASDRIAALIHDARNMVTAIDLYCDLLDAPGVLSAPFRHYAGDLRLIAGGSRRLLEQMARMEWAEELAPDPPSSSQPNSSQPVLIQSVFNQPVVNQPGPDLQAKTVFAAQGNVLDGIRLHSDAADGDLEERHPAPFPLPRAAGLLVVPAPYAGPSSGRAAGPSQSLARANQRLSVQAEQRVESLADELLANQRLLSALVGPGITIGVAIEGGNKPANLTTDDFTRVLVNLARNAAEAMPTGGHIQIELFEIGNRLQLSFADSGTGISESALEAIFASGYTTKINLGASPSLDASPYLDASPGLSLDRDAHQDADHGANRDMHPDHYQPVLRKAASLEGQGFGLAIVRSIVSAAGGRVFAANRGSRPDSQRSGLRFSQPGSQPAGQPAGKWTRSFNPPGSRSAMALPTSEESVFSASPGVPTAGSELIDVHLGAGNNYDADNHDAGEDGGQHARFKVSPPNDTDRVSGAIFFADFPIASNALHALPSKPQTPFYRNPQSNFEAGILEGPGLPQKLNSDS